MSKVRLRQRQAQQARRHDEHPRNDFWRTGLVEDRLAVHQQSDNHHERREGGCPGEGGAHRRPSQASARAAEGMGAGELPAKGKDWRGWQVTQGPRTLLYL